MRTWSILMLALCCTAVVLAQRPPVPPSPPSAQRGTPAPQPAARPSDDQTLSVNVNLVDILFTVADRKGKYITNLKKDDFKVFEDDKLQSVSNFTSETDLPLTVALLVDTSGSIRDRLKFEQDAATEFFYSTLHRGKDRALIISFDSGVDLIQDFTDDPEVLAGAVRKIRAGGGTSLYDATYLAVNEKLGTQPGRLVLILISDGDDNSSRVSMTETLELAQRKNVTIYSVSTNISGFFGSKEQERGDKTLKKFSEETGGKAFYPLRVQELATSFHDIAQELRSQYRIAYTPSNSKADGSFRKIRIDVADKRFKVRARTGYYAPRPTAARTNPPS